jgi:hypothetical protein
MGGQELHTVAKTMRRCCQNPDILELVVQVCDGFWVPARVLESGNRVGDVLNLDQGHKVHVGFMFVGLLDIGDVLNQCLGERRWWDLVQVRGNAVVPLVPAAPA